MIMLDPGSLLNAQAFESDRCHDVAHRGGDLRFASVIVVLFCLGMGVYFCAIQDLFYTHYQPFFDSLGYYDQLHAVMLTGQQEGWAAATYHAFDSGTTVYMPFLIASLLGLIIEPSRNIGVWIQTVELGVLMMSALVYFCKIKSVKPLPALLLLVPFAMTTCLYRNNGGMSDFRMDLSLYLTFSISCVWYLIATATGRRLHFFFVGLAIAVTCLFRATAPVYLVLGLGPVTLLDLMVRKNRQVLVEGLAIAFATAAAGSLWFYLLQFGKLHYYYFVWNTDANAKLPLNESVAHIKFAFRHIGSQFLIWIGCINLLLLLANWNRGHSLLATARDLTVHSARHIDWRLVWLAAAPLSMLVFRGAGLNQFVCMPAIVGILLLMLNPIAENQRFLSHRPLFIAAICASVLCLASVGIEGWDKHLPGPYNSMVAHKQTIQTIVNDAKRERLRHVNYGSTHMYYLNSSSLGSALRFDITEAQIRGRRIFLDKVQLIKNGVFSGIVADANWNELEGGDKTEKLNRLLYMADSRVDYLILPDPQTISFLEENVSFNIINQHQRVVRRHVLENGNWVRVGPPIVNSKTETVQLYRNISRTQRAARRRPENQNANILR